MDKFFAFPTLFFQTYLNVKMCERIRNEILEEAGDQEFFTSYGDMFNWQHDLESALKKQFADEELSFKITSSWAQVYRDKACHPPHTHKVNIFDSSNYSGILYLSNGGNTSFYKQDKSVFQENSMQIHSEFSKVVLFPSDLIHWAEPTLTDEPRIVAPFNCKLYS